MMKNNPVPIPQPGESREAYAVSLFESGYNCAQSVFAAYADLFGMDLSMALKMSGAMGGGVGRMREVCGAVSSMALLAGLKEGNDEKQGTIICRELLGIEGMEESAKPSVRTPEFYANRPCSRIIACAAEIIEDVLF